MRLKAETLLSKFDERKPLYLKPKGRKTLSKNVFSKSQPRMRAYSGVGVSPALTDLLRQKKISTDSSVRFLKEKT